MTTPHQLTILGGAREIGANSYHLDLDGVGLLLDAGMHPKHQGAEALPQFSRVQGEVDAILISHAHLDHVGALPVALKRFPRSRLYMTGPTALLASRMLRNSVSVARMRSRARAAAQEPGSPAPAPLFSFDEVEWIEQIAITCDPGQALQLSSAAGRRLQLRFLPSGHLLGAAGVLVQSEGRRVFYTGDTCATDQHLMGPAVYPEPGLDLLLMDCTHGADPIVEADLELARSAYGDAVDQLARFISTVADRGGCVLMPVFAMGRTQELLGVLHSLMRQGRVPPLPIMISGLAHAVCRIYDACRDSGHRHPELRLQDLGYSIIGQDALDDPALLERPCILAVTSGMMFPRTSSFQLASKMVTEPRHGVAFVGYVDPASAGYQLLSATRGQQVDLGGPRRVACDVARFSFSAHSRAAQLVQLVTNLRPRQVVLVHGDAAAVEAMADRLGPLPAKVTVAEPGARVDF